MLIGHRGTALVHHLHGYGFGQRRADPSGLLVAVEFRDGGWPELARQYEVGPTTASEYDEDADSGATSSETEELVHQSLSRNVKPRDNLG